MNRQERRRLGVKKKDPMISIKQSDIDAMKLTTSQMKVLAALLDRGLISFLIDSTWEWRK